MPQSCRADHHVIQPHLKRYLAKCDCRYNEREGLEVGDPERTAKAPNPLYYSRMHSADVSTVTTPARGVRAMISPRFSVGAKSRRQWLSTGKGVSPGAVTRGHGRRIGEFFAA